MIGLGRFGKTIAEIFKQNGYSVIGIDIDPEHVRTANSAGIIACYGDAEDSEFIASLLMTRTRGVVRAVHEKNLTEAFAVQLLEMKYDDTKVSPAMKQAGVVFIPYKYVALHAAQELIAMQV